jgi:hypothetical protein
MDDYEDDYYRDFESADSGDDVEEDEELQGITQSSGRKFDNDESISLASFSETWPRNVSSSYVNDIQRDFDCQNESIVPTETVMSIPLIDQQNGFSEVAGFRDATSYSNYLTSYQHVSLPMSRRGKQTPVTTTFTSDDNLTSSGRTHQSNNKLKAALENGNQRKLLNGSFSHNGNVIRKSNSSGKQQLPVRGINKDNIVKKAQDDGSGSGAINIMTKESHSRLLNRSKKEEGKYDSKMKASKAQPKPGQAKKQISNKEVKTPADEPTSSLSQDMNSYDQSNTCVRTEAAVEENPVSKVSTVLPTSPMSELSQLSECDDKANHEQHSQSVTKVLNDVTVRAPHKVSSESNYHSNINLGSLAMPRSMDRHVDSSLTPSASSLTSLETVTPQSKYDEVKMSDTGLRWRRGQAIGEGTFGRVYKGMNEKTGELMAVKQLYLVDGSEDEVKSLRNEITVICDIVHNNIVR